MSALEQCSPCSSITTALRTADGISFRACFSYPPKAEERMCVFAPSGQVGAYDDPGQENELYALVANRLTDSGYGTARFDVPRRPANQAFAERDERNSRAARLRRVLEFIGSKEGIGCVAIVGTSLGAETVLSVLSESSPFVALVKNLVLIGCVIENPTFVSSQIRTVDLVYGSMDHIAYLDGRTQKTSIIAAHVFGPQSAECLIKRSSQACRVHIWDRLGHTLGSYPPGDQSSTSARLAALMKD